MKKKNRNYAVRLLAMILALACLTGCGSERPNRGETQPPEETRTAMAAVAETEATEPVQTEATEETIGRVQYETPSSVGTISGSVLEKTFQPKAMEKQTRESLKQSYNDVSYESTGEEGIEEVAAGGIPANMRRSYNSGNCKKLAGNPYVISIFLDDDESSWSQEEVYRYLETVVTPGLEFLEQEAAKWGVSLEFQQGFYATFGRPIPVKYNGCVGRGSGEDSSKDILDQAAVALSFESAKDMHDKLQEFSGQEQIVYNILLNKGGRSYASSYRYKDTSAYEEKHGHYDYFLEKNVIFTGFTDDSGDTASDAIAHETLHMFGAEDYYMPEERKALAREFYPKDIMLCDMSDLQYFELGDYTAYCVGWTDTPPAICQNPLWFTNY